jgi:hypothetical protein
MVENKKSNFTSRIDFLSLDVEGAEEAVLNTLPWHRINIQSVLIEVKKYIYKSMMRKNNASNCLCFWVSLQMSQQINKYNKYNNGQVSSFRFWLF